jgi:Rieske Fe-S protein
MDKGRSIRGYQHGGDQYLIVVGEEHKTGHQSEDGRYYSAVTDFAQQHFGVGVPDYRWSAQNYRAADDLPYIGRSPSHDNLYVGTGYSTSGLVYGTVAGMLIADLILGRENRWQKLFDPRRFTPAKSAARLLKENVEVAADLLKDYAAPPELEDINDVPRGEGRIVKVGSDKLAVYRGTDGSLAALSPVCPHMKCLVRWNDFDKSWDCPCHGSRFHSDGRYIEGPALRDLEGRELPF